MKVEFRATFANIVEVDDEEAADIKSSWEANDSEVHEYFDPQKAECVEWELWINDEYIGTR